MKAMKKILVVDDEPQIRDIIQKYAVFSGYEADTAENGIRAVEKCKRWKYDLIVMDVMMPELDGFSALSEIRKSSDVPVIMLSARGEEYDKISGYRLGADDYVTKPFSPKILMLKCEAILKRTAGSADDSGGVYIFDGLRVDKNARTVTVDGKNVDMSPKEYDLIFYLVENCGIALTRDKLISAVWGYDYYGDERTLDTHIKLLRKSIAPYSEKIVTLRGVGYRFDK